MFVNNLMSGFITCHARNPMQNQDRFRKFKVNWVKFFCLFGLLLSISAGVYMSESAAAETKNVPCQLRLKFHA